MKLLKLISIPLLICGLSGFSQTKNYIQLLPTDTEQDIIRKAAQIVPSPRQLHWQKLELTAFFHFGINTMVGNEWGSGKEDLSNFNPAKLDARQWVKSVKDAGFKQVILTAKHHDGFCLWPSKYTEHTVKNTPYKDGKGDVVKELSDACKQYGVGFGVYLSPWDMNNKNYGDKDKYNQFFMNQLTELLTNYGRVDEVWFDGANGEGPNGKKQIYDFEAWNILIRKLQPNAVIAIMGPDVRWVGTESGQGRITEWSVVPIHKESNTAIEKNSQRDIAFPPQGNMTADEIGNRQQLLKAKALAWYPAETDVSIRPGWFYHAEDDAKVKTPEQLMDIYFSSVGRNGVLLLNIPPNKDGLISDSDLASLKGWKKHFDDTFKTNFLKGAKVKKDGTTIEYHLKEARTFDILLLREDITKGQRVEKFAAEYWKDNSWVKFTEGTTIGYKRLLRFDPIATDKIRVRIESSRLSPNLSELGLYKRSE